MTTAAAPLQIRLSPVPASAGLARTFVAHHLKRYGLERYVDDAVSITGELVANSVCHAGGPIWLRIGPAPDGTPLIEVWDASPTRPTMADATDEDEQGRGMWIVSSLAKEWGVDNCGPGKRVWAHL